MMRIKMTGVLYNDEEYDDDDDNDGCIIWG